MLDTTQHVFMMPEMLLAWIFGLAIGLAALIATGYFLAHRFRAGHDSQEPGADRIEPEVPTEQVEKTRRTA